MMSIENKFIFNETKKTYFQKKYPNSWCIVVGKTIDEKSTEYQVSDDIKGLRTESSDYDSLNDAMQECIKFNKTYPI